VPGVKYVTEGFRSTEVVVFPRSHFQLVGFPVERSEKLTTRGAHPEVGVAEKLASGWARPNILKQHNRTDIQQVLTNVAMVIGIGLLLYEY